MKLRNSWSGLLAFVVAIALFLGMGINAQAATGSVATNGNQAVSILVKVVDENGNAVKDATVTLKAHDYNPFAKTRNLTLNAVTDSKGKALFKISSSYDLVKGYSVEGEKIVSLSKSLSDYIGLVQLSRNYTAKVENKKYTVNFYDAAGSVVDTQTVLYGEDATAPEAPVYNGTLKYKMQFTGWDKAFTGVVENLNVNALYEKATKDGYYSLRLVNPLDSADDKALAVSHNNPKFVDIFGDAAEYVENADGVIEMGDGTAVKVEDQMRIDKFTINVSPSNSSKYYGVTNEDGTQTVVYTPNEDVTYTTLFNNINWNRIKKSPTQIYGVADKWTTLYTVRFHDAVGNVIETQKVVAGEAAVAPEAPEYNGDLNYMMKFIGWDKELSAVNSALDVYPEYEKTSKSDYYALRLVNPLDPADSKSLALSNIRPKFVDIFGEAAEYAENEDGVIEMGDGTGVTVEEQMRIEKFTINVSPSNSSKYHGVTNADGTQTVVYTPNADVTYTTCFNNINWNRVKKSVTQIFGVADEWTTLYTVRFYDAAGNVIDTQKVVAGEAAVAPEAPEYNGTSKYVLFFDGWDTEFNSVTSALDVRPVYKQPDFTERVYNPLARFYIVGPTGNNVCVTNESKRINYVFASDEDVEEDANGQIDMGDGTFITLDSLTAAARNLTLNKKGKDGKYYDLETVDGETYIVYTADDGSKKKAAASSIDWKQIEHTEKGLYVYGTAVWEDVVVEVVEEEQPVVEQPVEAVVE